MAAAAIRNFYASPFLPSAGEKQQNQTCGTHKSPALSHGCGSPCQALLRPMASRHRPHPSMLVCYTEGHPQKRGCNAGSPAILRERRQDTAGSGLQCHLPSHCSQGSSH